MRIVREAIQKIREASMGLELATVAITALVPNHHEGIVVQPVVGQPSPSEAKANAQEASSSLREATVRIAGLS
jgi:hypothetical protein